jgi:pentatricopeptide repeat protein
VKTEMPPKIMTCREGKEKNVLSYNFVALLRDCTKKKDLQEGAKLHSVMIMLGLLEKNPYLVTTLIAMYAKCGALTKAQQLHEEFHDRNVVSWNALISGYVQRDQAHEALRWFTRMLNEGFLPDAVTFTCILKACGSTQSIEKGIKIHDDIVHRGLLQKDVVLGTALVDMYVKCGHLSKAQEAHDELPVQDSISWSALIGGYVQQGKVHEALDCLDRMKAEGISPNVVTFTCILRSCSNGTVAAKGRRIHCEILNTGLLNEEIVLGTAVVDMYVKSGLMKKAQKAHDGLFVHDVISWSVLISGYAQQDQCNKALDCFEQMQVEGLSPDVVTFISVLKACGSLRLVEKGQYIHDKIVCRDLLKKDNVLGTALVDMYIDCGMLAKAKQVHSELPIQNVGSWNALIAGFAGLEQGHEALNIFQQMQSEGFSPDIVTFTCVLKACGSVGAIRKGTQIHGAIVDRGFLEKDVMIGCALLDMYVKCYMLEKAQKVHNELPHRTVISWSILISGFVEQGRCHEALECLIKMQSENLSPDAVTFICILKACKNTGACNEGAMIHNEILSRGMLKKDTALGNALIDMYAKCGMLAKAQKVHNELCARDVISWSALISGYTQERQGQEAISVFEQMKSEDVSPNAAIYTCILKSYGIAGIIDKGIQIHNEVINRGLLREDMVLGNALVDMYAKCGSITKAREVLQELPRRDVVSWNIVITSYAQQGQGHEAFNCFNDLKGEGISPNSVTFTCILNACTHSGLSCEAETYFRSMRRDYGIVPNLEHYSCMVILFGCAGHFDKALSVIRTMPSSLYSSMWISLLKACIKWGNVDIGTLAFKRVIQLDSGCAGAYISA